ncbi:MAG: thioredoxin-like protein [Monoraphidium minutum]|nr:MAG: thioredoxin-like protein [Monoraphidium minutum]
MGKPGLKLWSNPASRGQIVKWYIDELGVEAEVVDMDMKDKREHKSPEFLAVNPFGKLPAISDGGFNLFESGALLLYLADKYPLKSGLFTPQQRAAAAQWTLFANSTLANSVFVEQFREKSFPDVFGNLDKILAEREFLEGGKFSVSDVAVGSYLLYIPAFLPQLDLSPYPNVLAYMARLAERPACAATVAARAGERRQEETAKAPAPATTAAA